MRRVIVFACGLAVLCGLSAAPAPLQPEAKALVAGLSDPSAKVRDDAAAALKNRTDAIPWLRRAARSADKDTSKRAVELLIPYEKKRQEAVAKAIEACLNDNQIDLFMEWYHYWQPENKDDLWSVIPRASKTALELFAKYQPDKAANFEWISGQLAMASYYYDGPGIEKPKKIRPPGEKAGLTWCARTNCIDTWAGSFRFAAVDGPLNKGSCYGGRFFTLNTVHVRTFSQALLICDSDCTGSTSIIGTPLYTDLSRSMVVCRGNFHGSNVVGSLLLVDGDVDLSRGRPELKDSVIRASGEIRIHPDNKPENCTIEANVNNPTAPYKFFEFRDVGLHAAVDAKECAVANLTAIGTAGLQLSMSPTRAVYDLIVTEAKADTPIGNCGLAKGDRIRAIDDVRFESPDDFRKKLRRAMVRQGDCLLTIIRDGKVLDLPVFFPMPK